MAKPHPGYEALSKYLGTGFAWKLPLDDLAGETYSYEEVKEALRRLMRTDPQLHSLLAYKWLTNRSRNDIASAVHMDSSTVKRLWNKALDILMNHLRHGEREDNLAPILDPLDILSPFNR